MKAFTYNEYGDPSVLKMEEVKIPTPKENEVLIQTKAISINPAEWHLLTASFWLIRLATGLSKPKNTILGGDVAGEIVSIGKNVKGFKTGDRIFGRGESGILAQFSTLNIENIALIPNDVTFENATTIPLAGTTALCAILKGDITNNKKVLINGAAGGIGTIAIQLAKHYNAEVTAVCSENNRKLVLSLGAEEVIDYNKIDFTKQNKTYDLIIDLIGNRKVHDLSKVLSPKGTCVLVGIDQPKRLFGNMIKGMLISSFSGKKITSINAQTIQKDLAFLIDLVKQKKIKPIIGKTFDFYDTPDAFTQIGTRRTKGKILITI